MKVNILPIKIDGLREVQVSVCPTDDEFEVSFGVPLIPALIRGVVDKWPAYSRWSFESFVTHFGNCKEYGVRSTSKSDYKQFSIAEYVEYLKSTQDRAPFYLRDCKFHLNSKLLDDYFVPSYFSSWHHAIAKKYRPNLSWIYIGAADTYSGLHLDIWNTSAWNAVFSGKKLWLFFPPAQIDGLYNGLVNPFNPDLKKFPYYSQTTPLVCIQEPGEIVFTPSGWWHAVYNIEAGISLTENFVNHTNYKCVLNEFRNERMIPHVGALENLAAKKLKKKLTRKNHIWND